MDVPPQPAARDWQWAWWERGLLGLLGVGAAIGAVWLTLVLRFVVGLGLECDGPNGAALSLALGAGWAIGTGLALLVAVSLLRVCAGRRGLSLTSWFAVLATMFVFAMTYVGVALVRQPPLAEGCPPGDTQGGFGGHLEPIEVGSAPQGPRSRCYTAGNPSGRVPGLPGTLSWSVV